MKALLEFDEKEFWIQLFSIVARREERTEGENTASDSAPESVLSKEERVGDLGEAVEHASLARPTSALGGIANSQYRR